MILVSGIIKHGLFKIGHAHLHLMIAIVWIYLINFDLMLG